MSADEALQRILSARGAREPTPAERAWVRAARHHVLTCEDDRYPSLLRAIPNPPLLFVDGDLDALTQPQLAVVGSRNPSMPGRDTARDFAQSLAERGLAVTSGLAEGIDTAAHHGALAAQGITLAVLGSGIDIVYPRGNEPLAAQIRRQGALLSEFPLGTPPRRGNFPQRNRVIAGLSLGTLVVEAARRSGSLITARFAMEQGREVFAIPGSIHHPLSQGCHALIKQGAKLTETADDILSELNFSIYFSSAARVPAGAAPAAGRPSGMDKDQKILLDALGFEPADLDTLVVRTGWRPQVVSSMLLILELEGHVRAAPGGRYARVANRRAGGER